MSSLDKVVNVHHDSCDCTMTLRLGVITVGQRCAAERISYLKQNVMRPKHTRKTGGASGKARYERSKLRGAICNAPPLGRASAERDYEESLSPEYKAQLAGTHYNHRKKASGETAVKLGLAA